MNHEQYMAIWGHHTAAEWDEIGRRPSICMACGKRAVRYHLATDKLICDECGDRR